MTALAVEQLSHRFDGVQALTAVNLHIAPGERRAIIGPNGAGKSTLFNLIAGALPVQTGQVWLYGRDITHLPVPARANLGVGRTFQHNNLFAGLTALENVRLAVQHRERVNGHWFKPVRGFTAVHAAAAAILAQVGLAEQAHIKANDLAYGQQRALEMALALALNPRLLLLDEPTAGMSPAETADMISLIQSLPRDLTLLIVEHDMDVIFTLADQITVLHYGQVIHTGPPADVQADERVRAVYLGERDA
ncbi:MAG TPA: ABC transporter ATP-binding protein [Chloroflexota bacterium]|nr:ABC transporter ATP-binding protein [Chloroflexota bacterium]